MIKDNEVEQVIASMPNGESGFLKTWGLRQFGSAVSAFMLRRISDMTLLQIVDAARPKEFFDSLPEVRKTKNIQADLLITLLSKCPRGAIIRAYECADNHACGQRLGLEILTEDGVSLACIHEDGGLAITPEGKPYLTPRAQNEVFT